MFTPAVTVLSDSSSEHRSDHLSQAAPDPITKIIIKRKPKTTAKSKTLPSTDPEAKEIQKVSLIGKQWADNYLKYLPSKTKSVWLAEYKGNLSWWQNDVALQKGCKPLTIIWAMESYEKGLDRRIHGNIDARPSSDFFAELAWIIGPSNLAIQGVSADLFGRTIKTADALSVDVAAMIIQAIHDCPDTKVVLSGYQRGARVARLAAAKLSNRYMSRVNAFVTFCDSQADQPVHHLNVDRIRIVNPIDDQYCLPGAKQSAKTSEKKFGWRMNKYLQLVEKPARWLITMLDLMPGIDLDP